MVDDILVQFDDARAKATLEALKRCSKGTQVVMFTDHGHVVEQALEVDPAGSEIFVHER